MSDTEIQLMATIYDRIFDIVTYSPGGDKPSAFDVKTTFLQFVSNGGPLRPEDFENAVTPSNPNGSLTSAESFARMIDTIPAVQAQYAATTYSVDEQYGTIVNGANSSEQIDPKQQEIWDKAYKYLHTTTEVTHFDGTKTTQTGNSKIYKDYEDNKQAYLAALSAYRTAFYNYDLTDRKQQREWQAQSLTLQGAVDRAWDDWRDGAALVEEALQALDTSVNSAVRYVLERDKQRYKQESLTSNIGLPDWHIGYAMPSDWYAQSAVNNFTQISFNTKNLNKEASSEFNSYGGGGSASWGLWSVGGSLEHKDEKTSRHMDATNLDISLKLGVIQIFRPWLDGAIFSMKGWNLGAAFPKGSISTGDLKTAGTDHPLPLIPVGFVVARDIEISGDWSSEDQKHIATATSGSVSVGWGPFRVSGHYSHSSSKDTFTSNFQDGKLAIPGIQIVAWVSQIVPEIPPE